MGIVRDQQGGPVPGLRVDDLAVARLMRRTTPGRAECERRAVLLQQLHAAQLEDAAAFRELGVRQAAMLTKGGRAMAAALDDPGTRWRSPVERCRAERALARLQAARDAWTGAPAPGAA